MSKSMLFLPVAILGAVLLVLQASPVLWVPLLVIGIGGTVGLSAMGASHDDELRAEATGVTRSQRPHDETRP
ncbi:hypothetical protein DSM112329_01898 [Paraconexibacter sp. AEG42_29]|uniref:Uncharacterized protein n=1 Tax=Paraconexibacter sp. AEG42_29 TaxID=2997339 RepID=A0AAU7ATQ1_9ACTN